MKKHEPTDLHLVVFQVEQRPGRYQCDNSACDWTPEIRG